MKTVVISGASSNVGKTTLAREIVSILPGAVFIKIGHGTEKKGVDNLYYHTGVSFERIRRENRNASFLVIESNTILKEMIPDCVIYLPGENSKPSAAAARESADIIRGEKVDLETAERLMKDLAVCEAVLLDIINASGALFR